MINLIKIAPTNEYKLRLYFSDETYGTMDFSYLLDAKTVLTIPLEEFDYFQSCFIDFGALCWKNGLELSAESLYRKLKEKNELHCDREVA